ncbi:MAG: DNA repair protein RadA [Peptostreptococcaceae bacterium]|nr:DNA repair protein RadA [Peptostreptococcaceae bacterium]
MAGKNTKYVCQECGYVSVKWMGRCPECGNWQSFVEEFEIKAAKSKFYSMDDEKSGSPMRLSEINMEREERIKTGIGELDRVLGSGIVRGSVVLVGGSPGIGKSTLLLQIAGTETLLKGNDILYVSGEESFRQIKMRAQRIGVGEDANLKILSENNIEVIKAQVKKEKPDILIIDSIQTVYNPEITSAPGSVSQVRECSGDLIRLSKSKGISTFLVGHITKSGNIAGPKVLEHMVDTVLYFEGERHDSYKILRAVKNRFGSTDEIGIFEMTGDGLKGVDNPSNLFMTDRKNDISGSAVFCGVEGTRPILVEMQALVSYSSFNMPRRMASGVDYNRMIMLMAVLEKNIGLQVQAQDAYLNVVGGIQINEPASDLAIAIAIASSFRNTPVPADMAIFGEIGLGGEVRGVTHGEMRISEAARLGFKRCLVPKSNIPKRRMHEGIACIGVDSLKDAFEAIFG